MHKVVIHRCVRMQTLTSINHASVVYVNIWQDIVEMPPRWMLYQRGFYQY